MAYRHRPSTARRAMAIVASSGFLLSVSTLCCAQNSAEDGLSETIAELKAKASDGLIRVIVKIRPDSSSTQVNEDTQQQAIVNAKARIVDLMTDSGAALVEPIDDQPLVVIELQAEHLDQLHASGLVDSIEEDTIDDVL